MTYNVFGGTLSLTQSINPSVCATCLQIIDDKISDTVVHCIEHALSSNTSVLTLNLPDTAAINGFVSSWSENISLWLCLQAPGYGLTVWCPFSLLAQYKCLSYSLDLMSIVITVNSCRLQLVGVTDHSEPGQCGAVCQLSGGDGWDVSAWWRRSRCTPHVLSRSAECHLVQPQPLIFNVES